MGQVSLEVMWVNAVIEVHEPFMRATKVQVSLWGFKGIKGVQRGSGS